MQLSRAAHFAIRTVLDLAMEGPGPTAAVAARQGIPPAQAGKIVQQLARANIVLTSRGASGGIRLARPADSVSLRDVIDAIEGPLTVNRCAAWDDCPCTQPCPVRAELARLQREVERLFDGVTIAALLASDRRRGPRREDAVATPASYKIPVKEGDA
jgi:Rrf2 family protein